MSNIKLSPTQQNAIKQVIHWYKHETKQKQIFRLFGYAGTGKTTLTKLVIEELGLNQSRVAFLAFTGKAALVMQRHGIPAATIHSSIYKVHEKDRTVYKKLKAKLKAAKTEAARTEIKRKLASEKRELQKPIFILDEESPISDVSLIVLDEVSMVGEELGNDLLSFQKPILVLGDPGQLPPIKDLGFFTEHEPDAMLTEIHRQAAESPIIQIATMARKGEVIPPIKFSNSVLRTTRQSANPDILLRADQVICSRNVTRRKFNTHMKIAAGFHSPYPTGQGEKLICLKNQRNLGLYNGMFLSLKHIKDLSPIAFSAETTPEFGKKLLQPVPFYKGHFDDYVEPMAERYSQDYFQIRDNHLVEIDWGYVITCHKAQGSQWKNVVVINEGFGRNRETYARWLYTAITRAEEGLVILG